MQDQTLTQAEAIAMAISLEIKGRKFYLEMAEKTENPTGKNVFANLAREEAAHLRTFQAMLDKTPDLRNWRNQMKETMAKPTLPVFDEQARASLRRASADELAALRIAMKQEKEAMTFFEQAANLAEDDLTRTIFTFVKDQEVTHYDLLQAEHDHITQTGFWFDSPEFRMDGKA